MSELRQQLSTVDKVVGFRQVKREIEKVKQVYLAEDADLVLKEEVRALCKQYKVALDFVPSKQELGEWCEIEVACAVVGLTA